MFFFLVTPCHVVAVQPCIEWIPIKKMKKKKTKTKTKQSKTSSPAWNQISCSLPSRIYASKICQDNCSQDCQTILQTFPDFISLSNNTDIFRELLANNYCKHFSKVYIKQYWHFQRVLFKLNYSKNFFENSYHTIMTFSERLYQTVFTFSQSSYELTLKQTENSQTENSQVKVRKISIHKWNR